MGTKRVAMCISIIGCMHACMQVCILTMEATKKRKGIEKNVGLGLPEATRGFAKEEDAAVSLPFPGPFLCICGSVLSKVGSNSSSTYSSVDILDQLSNVSLSWPSSIVFVHYTRPTRGCAGPLCFSY